MPVRYCIHHARAHTCAHWVNHGSSAHGIYLYACRHIPEFLKGLIGA